MVQGFFKEQHEIPKKLDAFYKRKKGSTYLDKTIKHLVFKNLTERID